MLKVSVMADANAANLHFRKDWKPNPEGSSMGFGDLEIDRNEVIPTVWLHKMTAQETHIKVGLSAMRKCRNTARRIGKPVFPHLPDNLTFSCTMER